MRLCFLFITLLSFALKLIGQGEFSKPLTSDKDSRAGDFILEYGDNFITTGIKKFGSSPNTYHYPQIHIINAAGDVLDEFIIETLYPSSIADIILLEDSTFLMLGLPVTESTRGGFLYRDALITKANFKGEVLWEIILGNEEDECKNNFTRIVRKPGQQSNEFMFIGSFTNDQNPNTEPSGSKGLGDVWLVGFNGDGQVVWEKSFGSSGNDVPEGVLVGDENEITLVGTTTGSDHDFSGNVAGHNFWRLKLDWTGNIQDEILFFQVGGENLILESSTNNRHRMEQALSGNLVMVGSMFWINEKPAGHNSSQSSSSDGVIIEIPSKKGEEAKINFFGGSRTDLFFSGIMLDSNTFLAWGVTTSSDKDLMEFNPVVSDGWIAFINLNSMEIQKSILLNSEEESKIESQDHAYYVLPTDNSFLAFVGAGFGRPWLFKRSMNSTGVLAAGKRNLGISVYPNPARHALYIQKNTELSEPFQVQILSSDGRIVHQQMAAEKVSKIDITFLEKGVYILVINAGDKRYQQLFQKM